MNKKKLRLQLAVGGLLGAGSYVIIVTAGALNSMLQTSSKDWDLFAIGLATASLGAVILGSVFSRIFFS